MNEITSYKHDYIFIYCLNIVLNFVIEKFANCRFNVQEKVNLNLTLVQYVKFEILPSNRFDILIPMYINRLRIFLNV